MNQNTLTPTTENETLLMQFVTKSLLELGIKPNLKEFTYLKEVIFLHPDIFQKNKAILLFVFCDFRKVWCFCS